MIYDLKKVIKDMYSRKIQRKDCVAAVGINKISYRKNKIINHRCLTCPNIAQALLPGSVLTCL